MFKSRKRIIIAMALLWPLLIWGAVVGYKTYLWHTGTVITLPVRGYDPRDLLSGHYIIYEVEYGTSWTNCPRGKEEIYMVNPGSPQARLQAYPPDAGELFIVGACDYRGFQASIERFYVPEDAALRLDRILRGSQMDASIEVSVSRDGKAVVKNFLLDGKPWPEVLKQLDAAR